MVSHFLCNSFKGKFYSSKIVGAIQREQQVVHRNVLTIAALVHAWSQVDFLGKNVMNVCLEDISIQLQGIVAQVLISK